jgi:hypothetical protein
LGELPLAFTRIVNGIDCGGDRKVAQTRRSAGPEGSAVSGFRSGGLSHQSQQDGLLRVEAILRLLENNRML